MGHPRFVDREGELEYHYCCFCRSGFSDDLRREAANRDDVTLVTPDEIVTKLSSDE